MTGNKEKPNADTTRSDLRGLIANSVPAMDRYADALYKRLEPRLEKIWAGVTPSASEFSETKQLMTEYLTYITFGYFTRLIANLQDSVDAITNTLPQAQRQRLKELDEKVAGIRDEIDSHFAKRLSELFGKDGAGYIG